MGDNPQQPGFKSSWKQLIISCKNGHKQYFFSCNELCNLNLVKVSHGPSRHAEQTKKKTHVDNPLSPTPRQLRFELTPHHKQSCRNIKITKKSMTSERKIVLSATRSHDGRTKKILNREIKCLPIFINRLRCMLEEKQTNESKQTSYSLYTYTVRYSKHHSLTEIEALILGNVGVLYQNLNDTRGIFKKRI